MGAPARQVNSWVAYILECILLLKPAALHILVLNCTMMWAVGACSTALPVSHRGQGPCKAW